ncbi:MAG: BlaI/MecI/CopY family transcriptional regulator [Pseudomonadota bacterium]
MSKDITPTATELAILGVLWNTGPATVREVHDALSNQTTLGYTSALKMLQVMHKKGLVKRDESQRSHVYRAARPAHATQGGLVRDLIDKAFAGSAAELVVRALSASPVSDDELDRIRELIDQKDRERE